MLDQLPLPPISSQGWPWTEETNKRLYDPSIAWPKISIVTPSYNQGKFIEETIRSVLLQNYPNLEYIIIDGGSTDDTVEIIRKYSQWINYWVSEPDKGQSDAINKGLKVCSGDIFNWLNSDDWYVPDTFYDVAQSFLSNPSAKVVSGFENHIAQDGVISVYTGTYLKKTLPATIELCEISQPSTFLRLNAIKQLGPVSQDLHYLMDGEMWVRFLLMYGQQRFVKIAKPIANFRFHPTSKTVSNSYQNNFLNERSSIIIDLQRFSGVPADIVNFWVEEIYATPEVSALNRNWQVNSKVVTLREIKIYFIQRYIIE